MKKEFWFLGNWYVSKEEGKWCVFMKPVRNWLLHPIKTYKLFLNHKPQIVSVKWVGDREEQMDFNGHK